MIDITNLVIHPQGKWIVVCSQLEERNIDMVIPKPLLQVVYTIQDYSLSHSSRQSQWKKYLHPWQMEIPHQIGGCFDWLGQDNVWRSSLILLLLVFIMRTCSKTIKYLKDCTLCYATSINCLQLGCCRFSEQFENC